MPEPFTTLEDRIRGLAAEFPGLCTIAVTDVQTGEHLGIGENDEMPAASVIKVPVLAALYSAQTEGRLSLDDRIVTEERHRVFGTGVLQHLSPGVGLSIRDAATLMIIISDNPALELCVDALGGREYLNEAVTAMGMPNTELKLRLTDNTTNPDGRGFAVTTVAETCRLFEGLVRGDVVSAEASAEMLSILRLQQSRDKLGRDLPYTELYTLPPGPGQSWVASKDGINAYRGVRNDAAVFHRSGRDVCIAAFTELGETGVTGDHPGNVLLGRIGRVLWDWMAE